jgi:hypothetical protein
MRNYAIWSLPFVMPFVVLGLIRVVFWVAGAGWEYPEIAAIAALVAGAFVGKATAEAWEWRG